MKKNILVLSLASLVAPAYASDLASLIAGLRSIIRSSTLPPEIRTIIEGQVAQLTADPSLDPTHQAAAISTTPPHSTLRAPVVGESSTKKTEYPPHAPRVDSKPKATKNPFSKTKFNGYNRPMSGRRGDNKRSGSRR
jgi:hypothetical protein